MRYHHEKWDGSGYPAGLSGEAIPIGARIISAVDCLDALASDRQYRRALPLSEAMDMVEAESDKSFDPRVVAVLKRRYIELEQKARNQRAQPIRLSTEIKIKNGLAPAAGFQTADPVESTFSVAKRPSSSQAVAQSEVHQLLSAIDALGQILSSREIISIFAGRLKNLIPHDSFVLYIRQREYVCPEYVAGEFDQIFSSLRVSVGHGLVGWVFENNKSILNGNPLLEPGFDGSSTPLLSALVLPLQTAGTAIGVLALYRKGRDAFAQTDLAMLATESSKLAPCLNPRFRSSPGMKIERFSGSELRSGDTVIQ